MMGPGFDPLKVAALASEASRAAQADAIQEASQETEHRLEDQDAAKARTATSRPLSLRDHVRRLFHRPR